MWDTVNMQTQNVSKVPPFDGTIEGAIKESDNKPFTQCSLRSTTAYEVTKSQSLIEIEYANGFVVDICPINLVMGYWSVVTVKSWYTVISQRVKLQ